MQARRLPLEDDGFSPSNGMIMLISPGQPPEAAQQDLKAPQATKLTAMAEQLIGICNRFTKAGTRLAENGERHVSAARNLYGMPVLAAIGNVKAKIRLAEWRGDEAKLQSLLRAATEKRTAAQEKLGEKRAKVTAAKGKEAGLRRYDRSEAKSVGAQKAQNENMSLHQDACDELRIAERKARAQEKVVASYGHRVDLAKRSLEKLGPIG